MPATESELKKRRKEIQEVARPRPKIKESKSSEFNETSGAKLDRRVPSQEVLAEAPCEDVKKDRTKIATAVKAKAAPTTKSTEAEKAKKPVKPEDEVAATADTSEAVRECLRRKSTLELTGKTGSVAKNGSAKEKENAKKPTPVPPPVSRDSGEASEESQSEEESEEEDLEELKQNEEKVKAKKEAHARYMRFHRSLKSLLTSVYLWGDTGGSGHCSVCVCLCVSA